MSLESITIIAAATLAAWVLGVELGRLARVGVRQRQSVPKGRLGFLSITTTFVVAWLNLQEHSRTEPELLMVACAALIVHFALLAVGRGTERVSWNDALRTVAAVVAFWSVLHYAMNPRVVS